MAPSTPIKQAKRRKWSTVRRVRFFDALKAMKKCDSLRQIARRPGIEIPDSTARLWRKAIDEKGEEALRTSRKSSSILGRRAKVSTADLDRLTDQQNPEHELPWSEQAKLLPGQPSERTLRRHCATVGAYRYHKPHVSEVSPTNCPIRVKYGQEHEGKTLTGFWNWTWFTDEVYFQSRELRNESQFELRKSGQDRSHNVTKKSGLDVTLHCAGGVSYNHKGRLIFYKDPQEPSEKQRAPMKPRKSKYESEEQHTARVKVWEDTKPKEDTTPKGNCMTQVFYAEKILPQHIEQIQALERRHGRRYRLQEDGDPSHGNKSYNNPCAQLKRDADLLILVHPAQSPDLNPIEACWMIMKKRLRGRKWSTVRAFKADIQREWDKITVAQIRRRIREIPQRCKMVQQSNGERIKTDLW